MHEPVFLSDPDLQESPLLRILFRAFKTFGANPRRLARLARVLEGGATRSRTLRRILWHRYGVQAEAFSYGSFHEPGVAGRDLVIGRYASISRGVSWGHNHPSERVAMSPVFYEPGYGINDRWTIDLPGLDIGPDAWIGAHVVIVGTCRRIGVGAVVGAGAVVTRDVPDFAIVVGAPARVVRHRFPPDVQEAILKSRWWEHSPRDLARFKDAFDEPAVRETTLAALARLEAGLTRPRADAPAR